MSHAMPGVGSSLRGRGLVLAALLVAVLNPALPGPPGAPALAVLLDDSLSMPRAFTDAAWEELQSLYEALPAGSSVSVSRFATEAVSELQQRAPEPLPSAVPRGVALDRAGTDIEQVMRETLFRLPAKQPAAVLLVSDGASTRGDARTCLEQFRDSAVPVYLLRPPQGQIAGPRLLGLETPSRAELGQQLDLRVDLAGPPGSPVELQLLQDGLPVGRGTLVIPDNGDAAATFSVVAQRSGFTTLTVRIAGATEAAADPGRELTEVVSIRGDLPVLYLGEGPVGNRMLPLLSARGREVQLLAPDQLAGQRNRLREAGVIVLDDVAIRDLDPQSWQVLGDAVRELGTGLLVLGGANSFGAGAYRHSHFEQLLPVTAESLRSEDSAAVLFLLDRSGSMAAPASGPDRFALARKAVQAAARQLAPGDLIGITTFADRVDVRLPLSPRGVDPAGIATALTLGAGGGTRLLPALRSAAGQLAAAGPQQRILVLVTDGFAGEEDLSLAVAELQRAGVTVIALAVGNDPGLVALRQLTDFNGGRILAVAEAATLPRLVSAEVASERAPPAGGISGVNERRPLPFLPGETTLQWPAVQGFAVSRPREGAELYLQADAGEPLLAAAFAAAGRVAVMPAGLGDWASAWWQWPAVGDFLDRLLRWLARGQGEGGLWLDMAERGGQIIFTVDQRVAGRWGSTTPRLALREPDGGVIDVPLALQAPGHYRAEHNAAGTGLYLVTLHGDDQVLQQAYYRNGAAEFTGTRAGASRLADWLEADLVHPWPGSDRFIDSLPTSDTASRPLLLSLAVLLYLGVLLRERDLLPWRHIRRLRARRWRGLFSLASR